MEFIRVMARGGGFPGAIAWAAACVLCLLQMALFLRGYRMSADDAGFLAVLMGQDVNLWALGAADAHASGRIGMYLLRPLNTLASYGSGYLPVRMAFVALYFSNFLLFSIYIGRLLRADIALLLFGALLVFHPLAFEHMPPTAYPLQNTLPILAILLCRLAILHLRSWRPGVKSSAILLVIHAFFALSMALTEYAFIFATALLVAEHGSALLRTPEDADPLRIRFQRLLRDRFLRLDLLVVALVFAAYATFRWFNPSQYDGNSPDGITEPGRVLWTVAGHLSAGTIVPQLNESVVSLPPAALLAALACGLLGFACFFPAARRAAAISHPGTVAVAALFLAIYTSLPLAVTRKQQGWCIEGGTCGFLDSRIAYLWLCLAGVCVIAIFWKWLAPRISPHVVAGALGVLVACMATIGYAHNWRQARKMHGISMAWERAAALACNPDRVPATDDALDSLVDPGNGVSMHPQFNKGAYWRQYIAWEMRTSSCPVAAEDRLAMYGEAMREGGIGMEIGERIRFGSGDADQYLDERWSHEPWGVWSVGGRAAVRLRLPQDSDLLLAFKVLRSGGERSFGPLTLSVDGHVLAKLDAGVEPRTHRVRIPRDLLTKSPDGITWIEFAVDDPSSPRQDGIGIDERELGVGLVEMQIDKVP